MPLSAGDAITITLANSNITIDFNGFKLNGLAAGDATAAKGVYAPAKLVQVGLR